jgi:hypothetical protein
MTSRCNQSAPHAITLRDSSAMRAKSQLSKLGDMTAALAYGVDMTMGAKFCRARGEKLV